MHAGLGALLCGIVAAGCSSTSPKTADRFVGTWAFTSGTLSGTGTCPGLPTDLTGQSFTMAKGTTTDLAFTLTTCQLTLSVAGTRAMADPATQSCMFTVPSIGAVPVTISSWTVDSTDGVSLTTAAMGSALGGICNFTLTGAATKTVTDGSAG